MHNEELKARGVRLIALLSGFPRGLNPEAPETVVFLVRPHAEAAKALAAIIRADNQREFHVFCVPNKTMLFERLLTVWEGGGGKRGRWRWRWIGWGGCDADGGGGGVAAGSDRIELAMV